MKRLLGLSACAAIGLSVACGTSDDLGTSAGGTAGQAGSAGAGGSGATGGTGGQAGSAGAGGSGATGALPIDELPARYAAAVCDAARTCWGDLLEVVTGGESCRQNTEASISDELGRIKQAITDGKVRYEGARMEACLAAVIARGCSDAAEPAACTEALDGTVAIGGDCSSNFECQGADAYCKSAGSCPGRCAARESAEGPCSTNDDCQAGLRCDREVGRCFRPAGARDRCGGGTEPDCGSGLFCLGEDQDQGQPGNCRTLGEAFSGNTGETCLIGAPLCQANLRCVIESVDATTGSLTAHCRPPAAGGAACKIAVPDMCPIDQYCAVPPQALDGTCTRKPGAGSPCAARGSDPPEICAAGTRCDGGQCRSRQRLGGSCQADAVCYSEHCSNGSCASAGACE